MILSAHEKTGLPFAKGLDACVDLPHTITAAIAIRVQIESLMEIPKDKRPPRAIWDKSWRLEQHLDHMYDSKGDKGGQTSYEYNFEDVE